MPHEARWLLAADLDGTVIPLEDTPRRRAEVQAFREAVESRDDLVLVYVTGRDLDLAREGIREFGLPTPHLLSCDVGTGIYRWDGASFQPDEEYRVLMERAMGGVPARVIRDALHGVPGLRLQEEARQGPYKVSYYLEDDPSDPEALARVRTVLADTGARLSVVFSRDPIRRVGLLDLLPAGVAKDHAVRFLQRRVGVHRDSLVYAGDSGNDRAAMLAGYRVVVVANASTALKAELRAEAGRVGLGDRIYFSTSPYAAGVLEGLRFWRVLED